MNHSIHSADRSTHLKIVVVALVAGIAVAAFGISARTGADYSRDRAGREGRQGGGCHQLEHLDGPLNDIETSGIKTAASRAAFLFAAVSEYLRQAIDRWRERRDSNPRPPP